MGSCSPLSLIYSLVLVFSANVDSLFRDAVDLFRSKRMVMTEYYTGQALVCPQSNC